MQETGWGSPALVQEEDSSDTGNGNGAEPARSRTRNSHLKALQYVPRGLTLSRTGL